MLPSDRVPPLRDIPATPEPRLTPRGGCAPGAAEAVAARHPAAGEAGPSRAPSPSCGLSDSSTVPVNTMGLAELVISVRCERNAVIRSNVPELLDLLPTPRPLQPQYFMS